ncbi:putative gustatory receptor 28b [Scaptodrosophila lebanonensis]|uniref:Gustatory receptor 28b n=1 Tax=Drosophila lebanonensis TaxID=7225 RepID=A0A6J2U7B6_DROLE|nr:putative gustatory receptor 28b [Scaptodrosophila lebanonensis]
MSTTLTRVRKYFISTQVYEALRPLFFLTFLYGLTPFHVGKRKMGEAYLKMSFFGVFNIVVYIVLCAFCYISSLRQGESIVGYFFRTEISTIGDTLQIFNGLIAGAVIYTSAFVKRCKLLGTLTILHSLDTNFNNIGIRVKYSRIFRYSILVIVFKIFILGIYFVGVFRLLVSLGVTPSFCVCMTFFLQHTVVSIAICLFCVIAFSFERRLSIINQSTEILGHKCESKLDSEFVERLIH